MSELVADEIEPRQSTLGVSHWKVLVWLDRTGLPSWQIGLSVFLFLGILSITLLLLNRVTDPSLYPNSVAFVAIVTYFLVLYLELARGWYRDFVEILTFDESLLDIKTGLVPSISTRWALTGLGFVCATINFRMNLELQAATGIVYFWAWGLYWLEYILGFFCIDIFLRQLRSLNMICDKIRVSLLEADVYSVLANPMLRFLRLYIFGLCIVFISYTVFTSGELAFGALLIIVMPFYLPGLIMLGLFMMPYNRIKNRIHVAKTIELNHVRRALVKGDKAHLHSSLIGEDADKLSRVDLMYYEDRISKIKELPFTDRIRGMLLFGVLPPLTWVIAALIEIFIESLL